MMNRRPFLQLLAGLLPGVPAMAERAAGGGEPVEAACGFPAAPSLAGGGGPPDAWLLEWLRLPMGPIPTVEDIPEGISCCGRESATVILSVMNGGSGELGFFYQGGSDPGMLRRVVPMLLFRKSAMTHDVDDPPYVYLLAFCRERGAARTFRLDRMSGLEGGGICDGGGGRWDAE